MKSEEIHLSEWQRIVFGQVTAEFYVEIIIRVAVIYLILMLSMRLMGKRMSSQLSRTEMVSMVSLAAAIGIPIIAPDRGILPVIITAMVIVLGQWTISRLAARNGQVETSINDDFTILIEDSVMRIDDMQQTRVTSDRLFAQLRALGQYHLGTVKRLYLEANGAFTLIPQPEPQPGLSVLPPWDMAFCNEQKRSPDTCVCTRCGNRKINPPNVEEECPNCLNRKWTHAVE